jgi:CDP-diacylglycerol--serine O-phosphatidyltransferase
MWVMQDMPRFGWTISVFFVLCAALRLARFNAQIDTDNQPHKSAGFNTGVPSPPGAALALLPMMIWFETGAEWVRDYRLLAPWLLLCAFLMVSNVATYSWSSIKIRRSLRFMALAAVSLFVATLVAAPWVALIGVGILYAGMLPFSVMSYARVKKSQRTVSEAT